MSNELGSVYEFQKSIADAEPPKPLPEGEYRGCVRIAELQVSKNSGNPMLVLTYFISPDQYPADYTDGNPDGETLIVYSTLKETPRTRYQLRKLCEMHGVAPSKRIVATDFIGQEVILRVTNEEYQGVLTARATPVRAV